MTTEAIILIIWISYLLVLVYNVVDLLEYENLKEQLIYKLVYVLFAPITLTLWLIYIVVKTVKHTVERIEL